MLPSVPPLVKTISSFCAFKIRAISSRAFVTASLHEGFGLPGVEALSFGLPLLASNTEVFNEIYDNTAIYFNPLSPEDIAEKMHLLVRDSRFYEQMQIKSYQRSKLFSWDKAARETLEVYQVASSPPRSELEHII